MDLTRYRFYSQIYVIFKHFVRQNLNKINYTSFLFKIKNKKELNMERVYLEPGDVVTVCCADLKLVEKEDGTFDQVVYTQQKKQYMETKE